MAHPRVCCHVGVGVANDVDMGDLLALAERGLVLAGVSLQEVSHLATIDARVEHPAIVELARHFGVSVRAYPAEVLEAETPRLLNPSEQIFARTGCHGVAEAAALASAGRDGMLVVGKIRSGYATVAVALAPVPSDT